MGETRDVSCSNCGTTSPIDFGAATYTTFTCGDCGTPSIAFR